MSGRPPIDLQRFLVAQEGCYSRVKREMQDGHKQSCWIWFIFPQILIKDTGVSDFHKIYAIRSLDEARAYLEHRVLGRRLTELTTLVLGHRDTPINYIMGWSLDAMKFNSSMTLFSLVSDEGSVFHQAIDVFFKGKRCPITLKKMRPDLAPPPTEEEDVPERSKRQQRAGKNNLFKFSWMRHSSDEEEDLPEPSKRGQRAGKNNRFKFSLMRHLSDEDEDVLEASKRVPRASKKHQQEFGGMRGGEVDEREDHNWTKKKRKSTWERLPEAPHHAAASRRERDRDAAAKLETCAFDSNADNVDPIVTPPIGEDQAEAARVSIGDSGEVSEDVGNEVFVVAPLDEHGEQSQA
jgi:uncharacterized protein (DUF1810 family)